MTNRIQIRRASDARDLPVRAPGRLEPRIGPTGPLLAAIDAAVEATLSADSAEFVERTRQEGGE